MIRQWRRSHSPEAVLIASPMARLSNGRNAEIESGS